MLGRCLRLVHSIRFRIGFARWLRQEFGFVYSVKYVAKHFLREALLVLVALVSVFVVLHDLFSRVVKGEWL